MRTRHGFTLTELLVVIVIIAVLVGLLTPALVTAVTKAREAAALAEINTLAQSLASFQSLYGTLPPSRIVVSESGDYSPQFFRRVLGTADANTAIALTPRTVTFLRKVFPRVTLKTNEIAPGVPPAPFDPNSTNRPPGVCYNVNGNFDANNNEIMDMPYFLEGDQCLVFFLGGVPRATSSGFDMTGFCRNPLNPFMPNTAYDHTNNVWVDVNTNRTARNFEFNAGRLAIFGGGRSSTSTQFPSYLDSIGGTSSPMPLVYFGTNGSGYDPDDCNLYSDVLEDNTIPYIAFQASGAAVPGTVVSVAPNPYTTTLPADMNGTRAGYWKADTYQILCAGMDRRFGPGGQYAARSGNALPFDSALNGSLTGLALLPPNARDTERDNLSNFASGRLGQ
jgi:general secretion pathway protein G